MAGFTPIKYKGGWLSQLPFGINALDFAGSGVVHTIGGFVGLAGAMALGPRFGRYDRDGKPRAIPGHSITLAALGYTLEETFARE